MERIKKILLFLCISLLTIVSVYATSETVSMDDDNKPIYDAIKFEAKLDGKYVYATWSKYDGDEKFRFYKLIRSSSNDNPVYPDDGYLAYYPELEKTKYVDYNPLDGTSYYRVCAITYENNRYCSNVIKIDRSSSVGFCTTEYSPVCGSYTQDEDDASGAGHYIVQYKKTYSNKCMLKSAGAQYEYMGKCKEELGDEENDEEDGYGYEEHSCPVYSLEEPKEGCKYIDGDLDENACPQPKLVCETSRCTRSDPPVCGFINGELESFANKCQLKEKGAILKYDGKCKEQAVQEVDSSYDLSSNLKEKGDKAIRTFIGKLEKTYSDNTTRIEVINKVITKLYNLEQNNPKYSGLINYMVSVLKEKLSSYQDDFSDIEDIFNDF